MNKWIVLLMGIALQGCWICPDPVYIEYDSNSKTIEVLSEDYYIKSITITEYIPKSGYIELIDSTKISIDQYGARGASMLSVSKAVENYKLTGENVEQFLKKKNLQYQIQLEKFENKKNEDSFDIEVIEFVIDNDKLKKRYNTKHPCP